MEQLTILKKILQNELFVDANLLQEKEKDTNGKEFLMKREIKSHKGIDFLLFRLDPNKINPFPYFNKNIGLSKICDYIMFVQKSNTLFILLIELKLGSKSATNQLLSSEEFTKFIINSGKRVGFNFTSELEFRKVKISESELHRTKTAQSKLEKDENEIIHYNHKSEFKIMEILHM